MQNDVNIYITQDYYSLFYLLLKIFRKVKRTERRRTRAGSGDVEVKVDDWASNPRHQTLLLRSCP